MRYRRRLSGLFTTTLLGTALLAGCASNAVRNAPPPSDWSLAAQALNEGRWQAAQAPLARLLQQDLRNGQLQFLHAYTEEAIAEQNDRARLELAAVGYANAERFAPGLSLIHI